MDVMQSTVPRFPAALEPDPSFRNLLGELAWRRLPSAVRERFAWKPAPGTEIRYVGVMTVVRASAAGWLIAQGCRLLGTPLAPHRGSDVSVTVTLRPDGDGHGIVWERLYRFAGRAPVRCVSVKKATGDGLVECVGGGVGMWLKLSERDGELHFRSTGFFWRRGRLCFALPRWLWPGEMHVVHADLGGGWFRFRIAVRHPLLGEILFQDGIFAAERS
ncbi:MAG TPA: DUF4166 domain-containing protein [Stellaceae bacterium]